MEKEKRRGRFFKRLIIRAKIDYRKNKLLFWVYVILRAIVIGIMVLQIFNGNYFDVFLCALTLFLFMIPSFFERRIKIDVPDALEIFILLFIFAAEILGEMGDYYVSFPHWDTILHTVNGFLCAAIGFSLINILNSSDKFTFNASPLFAAIVALCFSMTIGIVWEFFEFGMDSIFSTDMQKDSVLTSIDSVYMNPAKRADPIHIDIESVVINGDEWDIGGYLDIGLHDTMYDLLVNFLGAVVFSLFGYFYVKNRENEWLMENILPSKIRPKSRTGKSCSQKDGKP